MLMRIVHFQPDRDLYRLESYLRERYFEYRDAGSWLPERLHDLVYRVGSQEGDEGRPKSAGFIFFWEDNAEIVACVLPDGENVYVSIRDGYEQLLESMIVFSEQHCRPLFPAREDGSVKFWFAVSDSFPYMRRTLSELGYGEYPEKEYTVCVCPQTADMAAPLPEGFRLRYGDEYPDEEKKWSALRMGFHPEYEGPGYRASMRPYTERKRSGLYADSFECLVTEDRAEGDNDICACCFVYVDRRTRTALIEPVSTRERYRHRGIGTAMVRGAVERCREKGVEKCFVDAFGERKDFYLSAGFFTEDSISFFHKILP